MKTSKKLFLAIAALLALVSQQTAFASNLGTTPTAQTGWSFDPATNTATASNVRAMKMIMNMGADVKRGHVYTFTFRLKNYTAGKLRAFVGVKMPTSPVGSWVDKSAITPIADRFTLGIGTPLTGGAIDYSVPPESLNGPGRSGEDIGSFRIFCTHAWFGLYDPILNPNLVGSHIHEGIGNTAVNEKSDYASLRRTGSSTCQDNRGNLAKYPVNLSAYWWPAVMDGAGHVIRENGTLIYYKGPPGPPGDGIDYNTNPSAFGGVATSTGGTTITRSAGAAFNLAPPNPIFVGGTIYLGPNQSSVAYTVASIPDADHLVLTTAVPAGTMNYNIYPPSIYNAAAHQCNDEWGGTSLTLDPNTGETVTEAGRCPQIPTGMKYIFGYNKANGQGRPDVDIDIPTGDNGTGAVTSGTKGTIVWDCWMGMELGEAAHPGQGSSYAATQLSPSFNTLADIQASLATHPEYCPLKSVLHFSYGGPTCWDGHHVDSPDHRAHVGYGIRPTSSGFLGNQRCPSQTPYPIPQMGVQNFYSVDAQFIAGKWHLSIDEMVDGLAAGVGAHMDYFWAWSPTAENHWFTHCIHPHNSCTNDLGDGTSIPGPKNFNGADPFCNGCMLPRADRYVSTTEFGMSPDYTANGTYTIRMKAPDSGVLGLMGLEGFTGQVDNIVVTEVPTGAHGPVTVGGMASNDNQPPAANDNAAIKMSMAW